MQQLFPALSEPAVLLSPSQSKSKQLFVGSIVAGLARFLLCCVDPDTSLALVAAASLSSLVASASSPAFNCQPQRSSRSTQPHRDARNNTRGQSAGTLSLLFRRLKCACCIVAAGEPITAAARADRVVAMGLRRGKARRRTHERSGSDCRADSAALDCQRGENSADG